MPGSGLQDALLQLTGTSDNPYQTETASVNGTGRYFGANQTFGFALAVNAASGTSPTLDVKIQHSADNSSWTDTGVAFTQVTASQVTATREVAEFPKRTVSTTATQPWLRMVATIGGTGPQFTFAVLSHVDTFPNF